jgi:hypothetical protein
MKEQLKKADVFGLVLVASALIAYFIRNNWTHYQTGVVIAGVALIVISLILKSGEIRTGLGRRSTKFGINSGVSVLLFVGVLALLNYLGEQHQKRSSGQPPSASRFGDESTGAGGIKQDVQVKVFFPAVMSKRSRPFGPLLIRFEPEVQFIDRTRLRQQRHEYQVTSYGELSNPLTWQSRKFGTIILDAGNNGLNASKTGSSTEEDITNALISW